MESALCTVHVKEGVIMDSTDSIIVLEVVRGQLDNIHHVMEQLLLSRAGLLDHVTFAGTILKPVLPVGRGQKKKAKKEKVHKDISPKPWRLNETRTVLIPMSITCVDVQKHLYAVEELTQLGSIVLSLKTSCDALMNAHEVILPEER